MRLCIPTDSKEGLSAKVHGHFGSAPYFTVYDTESADIKVIDNTGAHHAHGMCHPIGVIGTSSIDAVVCLGMGSRAVQNLNAAKIKAFRANGGTVSEIVEKYKTGGLEEITAQNACTQHGCH